MIIKENYSNAQTRYLIFLKKNIFSKKILLFFILLSLLVVTGFTGLFYGTKLKDSSYSAYFSSMYRYLDLRDSLVYKSYLGLTSKPEKIHINLAHIDSEKLLYRVTNAKNRGMITSDDKSEEVRAEILHNNENIKVKLKLRGSYLDHVRSDKWSFRVTVRDDNTLFGMKKFSLSSPETRNHIHEWIFQKALKIENLISLRYKFVEVYLNGKKLGIYALEEFFDKRLIENNKLREGLLVKPDVVNSEGQVYVYQEDKVSENTALKNSLVRLNRLLKLLHSGNIDIDTIVDINKSAKYFALSSIFGGQHGHLPMNYVAYFNPITNLLEPIGYDSNVGRRVENYGGLILSDNNAYHDGIFSPKSTISLLFDDEKFNKLYIDNLKNMTSDSYQESLFKNIDYELTENLKILYKEYSYFNYFKNDYLKSNIEYINQQLNDQRLIKADYLSNNETNEFKILIDNYGDFPIRIIGLFQGDNLIFETLIKNKIIRNLSQKERLVRFYSNGNDLKLNSEKIYLKYKIFGSNEIRNTEVLNIPSYFYQSVDSSISDYINKNSNFNEFKFFEINNDLKTISLPSGEYVINKNLIIPKGYSLYINPDVEIDLINSSGILSYSTVYLNGSKERPIRINSTDLTGQGLTVIGANDKSNLKFVDFNNMSNFSNNNWALTGGVNFYMSDVDISNTSFKNSNSEDALNIIKSKFKINQSIFNNILSDAFDSDFSEGSIENTSFYNCGNDCVDLSGSSLDIDDVIFNGIGDKAISAGEASNLRANNVVIKSAELGVTSKDSSIVEISNISIDNTNIGFTAFTKKSEYGPAKIIAKKILLKNVQIPYLIENSSEMKVDGSAIPTVEFTVEDVLYGNLYGASSK